MRALFVLLFVFASFTSVSSAFAQKIDIQSVARPADANETALVWAAVNSTVAPGYSKQGIIDDLPYPQAPGVILVTGLPNDSREKRVEYVFSGLSGYVTSRVVVGEQFVPLQTWFFDKPVDATPLPQISLNSMTLHDGLLLQGSIRFDVFNVDGGRVSKLSRVVSFGCCSVGPQIRDVFVFSPKTILISGVFVNPTVMVGSSVLGLKTFSTLSGFIVELPYEFQQGD